VRAIPHRTPPALPWVNSFGPCAPEPNRDLSASRPLVSGGCPASRREEVAQLAGVGVAWYTWLEQGRNVNVSSDVLERLHAALALSPAEREHLFALAHNRPPPNVGFDGGVISQSSAALLGRMADAAYVANRRWDVLAWNAAAAGLFRDLASAQGRQPNMMRFLFTSPTLRSLHVDWETDARGNPPPRAAVKRRCAGGGRTSSSKVGVCRAGSAASRRSWKECRRAKPADRSH
jgi:transcriptional regulator with XRE-family HTH domain